MNQYFQRKNSGSKRVSKWISFQWKSFQNPVKGKPLHSLLNPQISIRLHKKKSVFGGQIKVIENSYLNLRITQLKPSQTLKSFSLWVPNALYFWRASPCLKPKVFIFKHEPLEFVSFFLKIEFLRLESKESMN